MIKVSRNGWEISCENAEELGEVMQALCMQDTKQTETRQAITTTQAKTRSEMPASMKNTKRWGRAFKRWSATEETDMMKFLASGMSVGNISSMLQRKTGAVRQRIWKIKHKMDARNAADTTDEQR